MMAATGDGRAADFETKDAARDHVWELLQQAEVARFPFPPHGRIPNFAGAEEAARRLVELPFWQEVERIKVNPDAPQRPVRALALQRGVRVYMPTPRLRAGFKLLDPGSIPDEERERAAVLSHVDEYATEVPLQELPSMDAVVCGSVAVTLDGERCGKGEGYSDLEYAILLELGHPPAPVATTVHPLQLVGSFPTDANDLPLRWVVTPDRAHEIDSPRESPEGIDWGRLSQRDLDEMPVLQELRDHRDEG